MRFKNVLRLHSPKSGIELVGSSDSIGGLRLYSVLTVKGAAAATGEAAGDWPVLHRGPGAAGGRMVDAGDDDGGAVAATAAAAAAADGAEHPCCGCCSCIWR